jgi:predicted dehydrogenase/threonine dehydrogenase-like Zn-dependent dehydrogenase
MKQLFQNLRSGAIELVKIPVPIASDGHLVVRTRRTLISAGTERMLNSFARSSYIDKARQQPEKVREVLDKVRSEGLLTTYKAVSNKLDQLLPLGYSNVGIIAEAGSRTDGFKPGDRVLSNGPHAACVRVPCNLAVKIPDEVSDDAASFTVVGAIGLQGIRLIAPTLGETICVAGLGLIGLLAVQMLRANGCRVFGFDTNAERVALARLYGAEAIRIEPGVDVVKAAMAMTRGVGMDAVLITASTPNHTLISDCASMCRRRGRIVLTGVVGLDLKRADFYEKELTFQVSCSYGPGRYDPNFESKGYDYPIGFVRWTETRNFEAVLELMRDGRLDVSRLISRHVTFSDAKDAYALLSDPLMLGVILDYEVEESDELTRRVYYGPLPSGGESKATSAGRIALIGAGNFAQGTLLPALGRAGCNVVAVLATQGTSAALAAKKFGIPEATSDTVALLARDDVDAVMITTQHNTHARLVMQSLDAGKHVFVEKPLCLSFDELEEISARMRQFGDKAPVLMVGFNRRFAPMIRQVKDTLRSRNTPLFGVINCNAGAIPGTHWTQDPTLGGGRIIGEACHFIDLARFLVGTPITRVNGASLQPKGDDHGDTMSMTLSFEDGSLIQVNYFANGSKAMPKEHVMLSWEGKSIELTNYMKLKGHGVKLSASSWTLDKGHLGECEAFRAAICEGKPNPVPFDETVNVMRATFLAQQSAQDGISHTL